MVTLQILVLSFLVRIQVAQLKRLSLEGRFLFCGFGLGWGCIVRREVFVPNNVASIVCAIMQALALTILPTERCSTSRQIPSTTAIILVVLA